MKYKWTLITFGLLLLNLFMLTLNLDYALKGHVFNIVVSIFVVIVIAFQVFVGLPAAIAGDRMDNE